MGCEIQWGGGRLQAGLAILYAGRRKNRLCTIYAFTRSVRIELCFWPVEARSSDADYIRALRARFQGISGLILPEAGAGTRPGLGIERLMDESALLLFLDAMKSYLDEIKARESSFEE